MAKIFLIDDDDAIIETLKFFLEEQGHTVESYTNAKSALSDYKNFKPEIVFVDIFMPYLSGFEFIKLLREIDPNIYIIVMTGGFDPFNPESCLFVAERNGANKGIAKPLDFHYINSIIEDFKMLQL